MSNPRRVAAALALVLLAGFIVLPSRGAFDAFVESRSFASPMTWTMGMTWGFDFAWSVVLGALLGVVLRSKSAMLWAGAVGIGYGALNFAMTQRHLSSSLTWSLYAWIYGQYVVSCIGAVLGAWLSLSVQRHTPQKQRPAA